MATNNTLQDNDHSIIEIREEFFTSTPHARPELLIDNADPPRLGTPFNPLLVKEIEVNKLIDFLIFKINNGLLFLWQKKNQSNTQKVQRCGSVDHLGSGDGFHWVGIY